MIWSERRPQSHKWVTEQINLLVKYNFQNNLYLALHVKGNCAFTILSSHLRLPQADKSSLNDLSSS